MNKKSKIVVVALMAIWALTGCGGAEDRKAAHMQRGQAFFKEGNYEKARVEFKNVIQIDPKDAEAHYALGQAFESLQEWQGAVGQYLAAIQINPSHTDARVQLGQLFLAGNALEGSLEQAEEVIKRAPQDPKGYALRGGVRARQGDSAGARQDGEMSLKLDPGHVNSITLLASLYINK